MGYIQSGKTLSFTTVAALARDNSYPLVIVIAGTSVPLSGQSVRRLHHDLRLDSRPDHVWQHIHNPQVEGDDHGRISSVLAEWKDPHVPQEERRTALITVMKHHGHLNHLIEVLRRLNLQGVPVLIVDDEADQAGLNNLIQEGDESTTYQRLCMLKEVVPHHTFLQYTATPQGPLLINLIDVLSPGFAVPLTPGNEYTGGSIFFHDGSPYIREIPPNQIPTRDHPLPEPPESLLAALRFFFVGVASGLIRDHGWGHRSMMIHPSQRTVGHTQYYAWVAEIRDTWIRILGHPGDQDCHELIEDFRPAYNDLATTVRDLEPWEAINAHLLRAIRTTEPHLVNAKRGRTPEVNWSSAYSHILVGGQVLDRGFTVEGLTVTYMPRGLGTRRADTIQQRARFFGYKRPYLPYCRIYLEPQVEDALRRYVEHEEDVRGRLEENSRTGRPLSELRRAFLLTRSLEPTRDSIIDVDFVRVNLDEGWSAPKAPHESAEFIRSNRALVEAFLDSLRLVPLEGHPERTEFQIHDVARSVLLQEAYERLLADIRYARLSDAQNYLGVQVILRRYFEEHPEATCSVYRMSGGRTRERKLNDDGNIPNLFQGAYPVERARRGQIYPGDREIHDPNAVSIQLHTLAIPAELGVHPAYQGVPALAIWIPRDATGDVIVQDQGG
ncbi:MAG: Z1 domain-containing protein [Verrucomicrobia bacterium]|nr:Z1 domain-containing protein [Verrucomicrobiota bacterium]